MKYNKQTHMWESLYWHPTVTTDAVVFGFDGAKLNILLIERGNEPYINCWALPGGFIREEDKTAEESVYRELQEETSVENLYLEEFKTFSEATRDPRERVITIAFFALVIKDKYKIKGGDDAKAAKWFPIDELPPLAFDHDKIIHEALERIKMRIHFEPIGFHLLDKEFTMSQLQNIYIAILDPERKNPSLMDRRNFAKKMLKLGYIKPTGEKVTGNPYRSPKVYVFDEEAYLETKQRGMKLDF